MQLRKLWWIYSYYQRKIRCYWSLSINIGGGIKHESGIDTHFSPQCGWFCQTRGRIIAWYPEDYQVPQGTVKVKATFWRISSVFITCYFFPSLTSLTLPPLFYLVPSLDFSKMVPALKPWVRVPALVFLLLPPWDKESTGQGVMPYTLPLFKTRSNQAQFPASKTFCLFPETLWASSLGPASKAKVHVLHLSDSHRKLFGKEYGWSLDLAPTQHMNENPGDTESGPGWEKKGSRL